MAYTLTQDPETVQYNLGIGNEDASTQLHVGSTGTQYPVAMIVSQAGQTPMLKLVRGVGNWGNYNENWGLAVTDNGFEISKFETYTGIAGKAVQFQIAENGFIGIGTATPDRQLEVAGTNVVAKFQGTNAAPPQIEFSNDTGVQATIGLRVNHDFIIDTAGEDVYIGANAATAGAAGLFVKATGNVGIGTVTPATALDVVGTIRLTRAGTAAHYAEINGDGNCNLVSASGLDIVLKPYGTERLRIIGATGNVGIGTASPINQMHLSTGTAQVDDDGQLKIEQTNTTSGAAATNAGMTTKNYHGTSQFMQWEDNGLRIGSRRLTNSGIGDVVFTAGSDSEKMRISANGNVGIGAASSGRFKLHLYGSNAHEGLFIKTGDETGDWLVRAEDFAGNQRFVVKSTGDAFFNGGKVGIGTTAPDNPLEVVGSDSGIKISSDQSDRPHLRFECGTAEKLRLSCNVNYGVIGDGSDTNRYMSFKDGLVGIGNVAPAEVLHVSGGNLSVIRNNGFRILSNTEQASGSTVLMHNAYYSSGYKYGVTDEACSIDFTNGAILFRTAAAGSAGAAITWIDALSLSATGNATFTKKIFADDSTDGGAPVYSFTGDADTGFFREGANTIGISTGGTRRWSIGNGYITSQITGGARMAQTNGVPNTPCFSFNDDGNTGMYRVSADALGFTTGGTYRMQINAQGDVLIASASAGAALAVTDNRSSNWAARFENTSTSSAYGGLLAISASTDASTSVFEVRKGTSTTCFSIRGSGYAGISTAAAKTGLHVAAVPVTTGGGKVSASLTLQNPAGASNGNKVGINFDTNSGGTANAFITAEQDGSNHGTLYFGGYDGNSNRATVLTVDAGADMVGIGTESPDSALHIYQSVSSFGNTQLHIDNDKTDDAAVLRIEGKRTSTNDTGQILFANNGSLISAIKAYSAADDGDLRFYASATSSGDTLSEKMRITSAGSVGINTNSPSYKLHVNGTFYSAGSSLEYKQDIMGYNPNTRSIMDLRPIRYNYKEDYKHFGKRLKSVTQIGLIAEEVAEVFPELAVTKTEDGKEVVRNVDYEKLTVVLLAEVQKLRREVNKLRDAE